MSQAVLRLINVAPGTYSIRFVDFAITSSVGNFWVDSTTLTVSTVAPNGNFSQVGLIIGGTTVSVDAGNSSLSCWSYIDLHASGLTYTVYDDSNPNPSGGGAYVNGFWGGGFSLLLVEVGSDVFEDVILILNIDDVGDASFPGGSPPTVPSNFTGSEDAGDITLTWDADADAWTNVEMSISADIGSTPWTSVFIASPTIETALVNAIEATVVNAIEGGVLESQATYEVYFRAKSFKSGAGVSAYSSEWFFIYTFTEPPEPPVPDLTVTPDNGPGGPGGGLGWLDLGGSATVVFFIDPSGIYTITKDKRYDTLYAEDPNTVDVAIPTPFIKTAIVGE